MLREIKKTRRAREEMPRRWFADESMDLIVWLDRHGGVAGFQLCYDKPAAEHALSWWEGRGYAHNRVDDGEGRPGSYKGTPILVADGAFDIRDIAEKFRAAAAEIDPRIAEFVYRKLSV
jgi:hypothetical protein